jgi:hypothetical protein
MPIWLPICWDIPKPDPDPDRIMDWEFMPLVPT